MLVYIYIIYCCLFFFCSAHILWYLQQNNNSFQRCKIFYFPVSASGFYLQTLMRKYECRICALIHSSRAFFNPLWGIKEKKKSVFLFIMQESDFKSNVQITRTILLLLWVKTRIELRLFVFRPWLFCCVWQTVQSVSNNKHIKNLQLLVPTLLWCLLYFVCCCCCFFLFCFFLHEWRHIWMQTVEKCQGNHYCPV